MSKRRRPSVGRPTEAQRAGQALEKVIAEHKLEKSDITGKPRRPKQTLTRRQRRAQARAQRASSGSERRQNRRSIDQATGLAVPPMRRTNKLQR